MVDALDGPLTPTEQRVLGALAEKEATVPDTYPMTLRGLQSACNQKNNREPVTDLDERAVQATLDELKARNLVRFVYASHGARTTKYRHVLHERLRIEPDELAVLTPLLLRGPQTVNELRVRTERAHRFDSNKAVLATLEALAGRDEPLVVHLARQPGQKETRWTHRLGDPEADTEAVPAGPAAVDDAAMAPAASAAPPAPPRAGLEARVAELEDRVAALEAFLADLGLTTDPHDREQPPS